MSLNLEQFDSLAGLHSGRQNWKIRVRMIGCWNVVSSKSFGRIKSIEMVLLDEYGSKIQATIKKRLAEDFKNVFQEGFVYVIRNVNVVVNVGYNKVTSNLFWIYFTKDTVADQVEGAEIPYFGVSLVSIADVLFQKLQDDSVIDVMGFLVAISAMKTYTKHGYRMISLEMLDAMGNRRIQCQLYNEYVDCVEGFLVRGNCSQTILIIQFGKVRVVDDGHRRIIENDRNATKLLFNLDIVEAIEFRNV